MSPTRSLRHAACGLAALAFALQFCAGQVWGQSYGAQATSLLAQRSSEELSPQFEVVYTTPALYKWYGPRHLSTGYQRPWYQDQLTNYAQQHYQRYLNAGLEGDEWHDAFGRRLGRGWLVYTWEQEQPGRNGSRIRQGSFYSSVFGRLVISSDTAGGGTYRLMVGSELDARLTPMTFFKPNFEGVRLDYATDRLTSTFLFSRPSDPGNAGRTNFTHVAAGHAEVQLFDLAKIGATYVNAHTANSEDEFSVGNPLAGVLTTAQNQALSTLWVQVRDDSPMDGSGGATVFGHDIILVDTAGVELRGSEIDFLPAIAGARLRDGALVADGSEMMLFEYDLASLRDKGVDPESITAATIEMALANDYHVEMASDLQTNGERFNPETVLLTYARAEGNVQDDSNGELLRLGYGLPTGNELIGLNWDLVNWGGLSVQGEAVLNRQHRRYPNTRTEDRHEMVRRAHAAYGIAAYQRLPINLFVEGFHIADAYSTSFWLPQAGGIVQYEAPVPMLYEFVDDDDDHDSIPEWQRPFQRTSQGIAWPGYDVDGDFLHDYNQNNNPRPPWTVSIPGQPSSVPTNRNRNLIPDYEESFLRFRSDRPEFLFGVDMNHNGTPDPFENDLMPDYPYKADHRGINAYARWSPTPQIRLLAGRQDMGLISGDGNTESWYAMLTWTRRLGRGGRLRVFDFGALVQDDIRDDLQTWVQPLGAVGRMRDVRDLLAAQDTWRNTLYIDADQRLSAGLRLFHRLKWESWWQRRARLEVADEEGRMRSGFLGVINKGEWTIPIGLGVLEPRVKSEFRADRPFSTRLPTARSHEMSGYLMWTQPIFAEQTSVNYYARYGRQLFDTELQVGLELVRFWMLEGTRPDVGEDFNGQTVVAQIINRVGYLGYHLVTRAGIQYGRRNFESIEDERTSMLFVTMNAGLQ